MHTTIVRSGLIGLALAAFLGASPAALAEVVNYKATMNAQNNPQPNASTATGTAEVAYDTTSKMLTWTVTFNGLTGPATAAHFHGPAAPGANAGVALLIGNTPASPAKGTATLTDAQAADLMGGRWYVNIHTEANRGGEIRGWLMK
jgi:CHRD domain